MMTSFRPWSLLVFLLCSTAALAQQKRLQGVNIGEPAPEIAMRNPTGDTLRLSDVRGKVVLLDFWASWCRPCRMENPHVRKTYHNYKDKTFIGADGFTVFSVSLDRAGALAAWQGAIAKDSLDWLWHVGAVDDGMNQAATRYQVAFIPTNVLIDGNGKVIATDVHGEALDQALEGLLEKDPVRLEEARKKQEAQAKAAAKAAKKKKKKA